MELDKLSVWFHVNKISLNVLKTYLMVFWPNKNHVNEKVMVDGKEIERVICTKFLGVLINDMLNWPHQIDNVWNNRNFPRIIRTRA